MQNTQLFSRTLVCLGGLAIILTCVANVLAVCADKRLRPNSPCLTQADACTEIKDSQGRIVGCVGNVHDVKQGDFQCDVESSGDYCTGTGSFASCYTHGPCKMESAGPGFNNRCVMNLMQAQSKTQETVGTWRCPG